MSGTIGRRAAVLGGLASLGAARASQTLLVAMAVAGGRCVVTVMLDGRPARMLLDTGAQRSIVTRSAMNRLRLRPDSWVGSTLTGAGGMVEHHANADVAIATLGGMELFQRRAGAGLSLPVTSSDLGGVDGLLGGDVLRHHSIYVDMPRARLLLFPPLGQSGPSLPLTLLAEDLLLAPVQLAGCPLTALVDTGAASSLINARGLYRLGISPQDWGADPMASALSVGGRMAVRRRRFDALAIGPQQVAGPVLMETPVPQAAYDITLGLDVLGRWPFLLSYAALRMSFNAPG